MATHGPDLDESGEMKQVACSKLVVMDVARVRVTQAPGSRISDHYAAPFLRKGMNIAQECILFVFSAY